MIAVDVVDFDDTCWSGAFALGEGESGFMGNVKTFFKVPSPLRDRCFEECFYYQMV
jgi:hypothetical protein